MRNKFVTDRGAITSNPDNLILDDLSMKRDSNKLYKASVGSGGIKNYGETPMLETAETLKHTEDG